jgi:hypothetical protein
MPAPKSNNMRKTLTILAIFGLTSCDDAAPTSGNNSPTPATRLALVAYPERCDNDASDIGTIRPIDMVKTVEQDERNIPENEIKQAAIARLYVFELFLCSWHMVDTDDTKEIRKKIERMAEQRGEDPKKFIQRTLRSPPPKLPLLVNFAIKLKKIKIPYDDAFYGQLLAHPEIIDTIAEAINSSKQPPLPPGFDMNSLSATIESRTLLHLHEKAYQTSRAFAPDILQMEGPSNPAVVDSSSHELFCKLHFLIWQSRYKSSMPPEGKDTPCLIFRGVTVHSSFDMSADTRMETYGASPQEWNLYKEQIAALKKWARMTK